MNYLKNIDFSMGYGYSIYIRLYINLLHVSNIRKNEVDVSLSCKKICLDVMENPQNVTKNRGHVRLDPLDVRLNFEIFSLKISFYTKDSPCHIINGLGLLLYQKYKHQSLSSL